MQLKHRSGRTDTAYIVSRLSADGFWYEVGRYGRPGDAERKINELNRQNNNKSKTK